MLQNPIPNRIGQPLNSQTLRQIPQRQQGAFSAQTILQAGKPCDMISRNQGHPTLQSSVSVRERVAQMPPTPVQHKQRAFGNGQVLQKGQKFALGQVQNVEVLVGWDVKRSDVDVDISAFMLDNNRRIIGDDWFVFYGSCQSPDRSIHLITDGLRTDDKSMQIRLSQVHPQVERIVFVLTIDEALQQSLNFSMVDHAYIRLVSGGKELARFLLTEYYDTVTSMMLGELYRHNGIWKFNPIGDGVAKDLEGLCHMYGVQTT